MKPGSFALNPYAASYVPLSKRESHSPHEDLMRAKQPPTYFGQDQHHHLPHHDFGFQGVGNFSGPQKIPSDFGFQGGAKQMKDDDFQMDIDMDIEFLLVTFPGLSHESINDVYLANNRDLDATIEMLTQLEIYSSEAQEYLPDTLDIGDVPETSSTVATIPTQSNASKGPTAPSS